MPQKDTEELLAEIYDLMTGAIRPNPSWDYTMGLIDMITVLGLTDEWNAYVAKVERK